MHTHDQTFKETDAERIPFVLTGLERQAILELATRGPGGQFDPVAMTGLYNAGLVTVGKEDRQVKLTELGRMTYRILCRSDGTQD